MALRTQPRWAAGDPIRYSQLNSHSEGSERADNWHFGDGIESLDMPSGKRIQKLLLEGALFAYAPAGISQRTGTVGSGTLAPGVGAIILYNYGADDKLEEGAEAEGLNYFNKPAPSMTLLLVLKHRRRYRLLAWECP